MIPRNYRQNRLHEKRKRFSEYEPILTTSNVSARNSGINFTRHLMNFTSEAFPRAFLVPVSGRGAFDFSLVPELAQLEKWSWLYI